MALIGLLPFAARAGIQLRGLQLAHLHQNPEPIRGG